jgi:CRISPR/Cas system-associated exonuclease Cas4 (RecB family)
VIAAARGGEADLNAVLAEAKAQISSKIGWSAPDLPVDSIDDSEYDLSTFRDACRRKTGMAWLRQVSPNAARAIKARQGRWSSEWTDADGISADHDIQAALALKRWEITEHPYSPTALNQFARCPYRFYLSSIAGLKPAGRPQVFQRLDPLTRGHLYHRTLFWFLRGEGRALDDVLAELAEEEAQKLDPPIRGVWHTEIQKLRADLHAWVTCRDPEWSPQFIELAFGLPDRIESDPASVSEPVRIEHSWPLRGSIDLVEVHRDGRLRVLDHKSGTPDKKDWGLCVGRGEVLQPVLYALALEALGCGTPFSAALSWATLRGGFRTDEIRIDAGAREKIAQVLRVIDGYVHRGFLPAAPRAEACKGCEYVSVCGPWEEIRVSRKGPVELKQLRDIRGLR